jgi:mannose-1-phosphate guanylyltransferase
MEPKILDYIPEKVPFGFDDLMYTLLDKNLPVHAYIHDGIWMDLGRPEDFSMAQETLSDNQSSLLGV